jgi:hypothetical protein
MSYILVKEWPEGADIWRASGSQKYKDEDHDPAAHENRAADEGRVKEGRTNTQCKYTARTEFRYG